ncbi:MAG: hypothetical protein AB1540_12865, partial [Bdellovibrionota bacterium]
EWAKEKKQLDLKHERVFLRTCGGKDLGIRLPLPLHSVLDDTPIDSFLVAFDADVRIYETELLTLMKQFAVTPQWHDELEQTSLLWGREIAQECLTSAQYRDMIRGPRSVRGLLEAFHNVLLGGDFVWKPLLTRRYTETELRFELRYCPHRQAHKTTKTTADHACRLESMVYKGFTQTLVPDVHYQRHFQKTYCQDELTI